MGCVHCAPCKTDCWMLATRDANGNQVPNPEKFPDGFAAVTAYIHGLGLQSGLYTAKGPNTCAGFAASCDHEGQDGEVCLWCACVLVIHTSPTVSPPLGKGGWCRAHRKALPGLRQALTSPPPLPPSPNTHTISGPVGVLGHRLREGMCVCEPGLASCVYVIVVCYYLGVG